MSEAESDPLIGKVLSERFEILSSIGVGGMGRVYKAIQRPLGREVALKVLNPRYASSKDPGFERRFFLEASITSKLKHPNTITVHDYGRTDEGVYYIAMEYLEGDTLQKVLSDQGRLPWQRALFIVGQIARSLREAHKMGLVHRDLKPANIMLMSEGSGGDAVKVLDFGLVKSFVPDADLDDDAALTKAGVLMGSPLYMAPEQTRGEADARTDIYALGVVMFQLMAGRPPFFSKDSIEVIVKHVKEKPPVLSSLVADLPAEVNALVLRCLEKDPAQRFQSTDQLLDALRSASYGHDLSGAFADPRRNTPTSSALLSSQELNRRTELPPPPPLRSRNLLTFFLGVGLLFGVSVAGVIAWKTMLDNGPRSEPISGPSQLDIDPSSAEVTTRVVTFEIDSTPSGATVTESGEMVGITPFRLERQHQSQTPLSVEFTFTVDGYEPHSLVAEGLEGLVTVNPQLTPLRPQAKPSPRPATKVAKPTKAEPAGYKDDPY